MWVHDRMNAPGPHYFCFLTKSKELDLSFNEDLENLQGIKALVELTSLNVDGCKVSSQKYFCLVCFLYLLFVSGPLSFLRGFLGWLRGPPNWIQGPPSWL